MPFRTLSSKSSMVKLFTTKYFSSTFSRASTVPSRGDCDPLASVGFGLCVLGIALLDSSRGKGDCVADGPIGVPAGVAPVPLRSLHTNLTPWKRESWNRVIAAAHAPSDL